MSSLIEYKHIDTSFLCRRLHMKNNAKDPFSAAAALLAPTNTPSWLPEFLRSWLPSLSIDRGVYAAQPTKVQMRNELLAVAEAAATLQHALQDPPIREFLEIEGGIQIENNGALDNALRTIRERALLASESKKIATTKTAARKGRGKALPAGATSPKAFCALVISEVWKSLYGEYPAPRNVKAAKAADAYWVAAGGQKQANSSEPFASWRYHFRKAKPPAMDKIRKEICRHIKIHESDQTLSGGK